MAAYQAEQIQVLSGLDPVRKRPGMYTDTSSPDHLAREVLDNSVDEALGGHAHKIVLSLHPDGSLTVRDDGRGMPVDIHPEHHCSGVELILCTLHAGAKFDSGSYEVAGGLHGVGVSVVNALSSILEITVRRDGGVWWMKFKNGEALAPLQRIGTCGKRNTGTQLRFWPDPAYFENASFSRASLASLLLAKAVLCPGLEMVLEEEREDGEKKREKWCYQNGLGDYLGSQLRGTDALIPQQPLVFQNSLQERVKHLDWALQWFGEEGRPVAESYANLVPTPAGGTHVNGFRNGVLEAVREYCQFSAPLPRGLKLNVEDVFSHCAWIFSLRMVDPQFSGQKKEKLESRDIASPITSAVRDTFSHWLHRHTEEAKQIADLAVASAESRRRAAAVKRKRPAVSLMLPGKLSDCTGTDIEQTELFLVEGDSAGGSAKQARDRKFQAILPLRGKILNTWELKTGTALASREIHDIAVSLGVQPAREQRENSLAGLRYGKVCIMADADSDGRHIATLLCALFVRHFFSLVEAGRVHVAMPPLFRINAGDQVWYALDEEELEKRMQELQRGKARKLEVQRFKGLGEMNPAQLRETAMAPATRHLVQLTTSSGDGLDKTLDRLLARNLAAERREWLEGSGNRSMLAESFVLSADSTGKEAAGHTDSAARDTAEVTGEQKQEKQQGQQENQPADKFFLRTQKGPAKSGRKL